MGISGNDVEFILEISCIYDKKYQKILQNRNFEMTPRIKSSVKFRFYYIIFSYVTKTCKYVKIIEIARAEM